MMSSRSGWFARLLVSLRFSVPGMVLLLGGLLGGIAVYQQVRLAYAQFEAEAIAAGHLDGKQASALLDYLYRNDHAQTQNHIGANLLVSQLANRPHLTVALLLDEQNRVAAATDYQLRGERLTATSLSPQEEEIAAIRAKRAGQVWLTADQQRVISAYPVVIGTSRGELVPSRVGVLLLDYNLTTLKQTAMATAMARSGPQALSLIALCLLVCLFLELTVTRRAARLVKASQSLAQGDLTARAALQGADELAQIAQAFDQMAGQLQHDTEALQTSETELRQKTTDLTAILQELQQAQLQLVQTEKMSSLGQLVAGVAHEINNPVNFIYGNITHTREYAADLLNLLALYQHHYPQPEPDIEAEIEAIDLDFLKADFPHMLQSMKVGAERIQNIVKSLRVFSRMDEAALKAVNVHEGIDSTLMILHNRLKAKDDRPEIMVVQDYGALPLVECYAGQLNQVFMNILSNAIDALEDAYAADPHLQPRITIKTRADRQLIAIDIGDNGPGIPPAIQARLFDPFYTTKPVGKGTGMGLSISYQIVTETHGGKLICSSTPELGTTFHIQLPLHLEPPTVAPQAAVSMADAYS